MAGFILFALIVGAVIFCGYLIYCRMNLIAEFRRCNVIVFGKKGNGKDLIFQYVINARRKAYLSNIDYGGKREEITAKGMQLGENTYHNFICGTVETVDKSTVPYEGRDIYFSDCGIILPSQCDSTLHKVYPGFPISYALSRHLWGNNVHCNTQALGRVWKALREQADSYIMARGVIKLPGFLVVKYRIYDKYETAETGTRPLKLFTRNKYTKGDVETFSAQQGRIQNGIIIISKRRIKYDTRAYHEIIFGEKFRRLKKKG